MPITASKPILGKVILQFEAPDGHHFSVHRVRPEYASECKPLSQELKDSGLDPNQIFMKFAHVEKIPEALNGDFFTALLKAENDRRRRHLIVCQNGSPHLYAAEVGLDGEVPKVFQVNPFDDAVIRLHAGLIVVTKRPMRPKK